MYRSRLVPRLIPVLGLIGAPLLLSFPIGTMFGITTEAPAWAAIAIVPIFFWELSLGLWMTFKGFNPNAPIAIAASPDTGGSGNAVAIAPQAVAATTGPA